MASLHWHGGTRGHTQDAVVVFVRRRHLDKSLHFVVNPNRRLALHQVSQICCIVTPSLSWATEDLQAHATTSLE